MSIGNVRADLARYGLADRIREFDVPSGTVAEAAAAIGCEERQIAKTLSLYVGADPIVIVVAGDARIVNAKYKAQFHTKPRMIPAGEVEAAVGHAPGGVCPFGLREGVAVYLDESLRRFNAVYPACGSGNSALRITLPELERVSHPVAWVVVCKDWE